ARIVERDGRVDVWRRGGERGREAAEHGRRSMPGKRYVARRRAVESGAFRRPMGGVLVARSTWCVCALALVAVVVLALPSAAGAAVGKGTACIAKHPNYVDNVFEVSYAPGCTGHDEPELDPLSSQPHSATNLTWKAVLPVDGVFPVSATGFGFWFGGTVTDPNPKALFNQGFLEAQFYPDTLVSQCRQNGDSVFTFAKNTYTVCSPVWSIVGNPEPAAYNAMLRQAGG